MQFCARSYPFSACCRIVVTPAAGAHLHLRAAAAAPATARWMSRGLLATEAGAGPPFRKDTGKLSLWSWAQILSTRVELLFLYVTPRHSLHLFRANSLYSTLEHRLTVWTITYCHLRRKKVMLNISRMLEGSYWWPCSFRSSSRLPEYSGGAGSSSGAVRREYTADAPVTSSRRYEDPYDRERSSSDYYRRSSPPPPG